jgi:hypothetical protein
MNPILEAYGMQKDWQLWDKAAIAFSCILYHKIIEA